MNYIVIEKFDREYPVICMSEEGLPLIFDSLEAAQEEADDCQDGIVVEYN